MASLDHGSARPLAGVRVVGVEHSVAGPLCTRILGELGADVIKVERPDGGDFSRHWDENVAGESAQFWWLNRSKRSVALDLKSAAGRTTLDALLDGADALVHNLAPASAERLQLDAASVEARFPGLVNCQISGYGADGPARDRKAYDMLIQAEAGVMSVTGTEEQPTRVGVSIADVTTGIYAALLVLAGLRERDRGGAGRHLDVAMFDVTLEFLGPMLLSYLNAGTTYPRLPDHHHAISPYGAFTCSDGERVLIAIEQDAEWQRFCIEVLEDAELASDSRYASNVLRVAHREELRAQLLGRIAKVSSAELVAAVSRAQLAYATLNDVSQVAEHPVVDHRRPVAAAPAPGHSSGVVYHTSGIAERLFRGGEDETSPPPTLGEHTAEVLASLSGATEARGRVR